MPSIPPDPPEEARARESPGVAELEAMRTKTRIATAASRMPSVRAITRPAEEAVTGVSPLAYRLCPGLLSVSGRPDHPDASSTAVRPSPQGRSVTNRSLTVREWALGTGREFLWRMGLGGRRGQRPSPLFLRMFSLTPPSDVHPQRYEGQGEQRVGRIDDRTRTEEGTKDGEDKPGGPLTYQRRGEESVAPLVRAPGAHRPRPGHVAPLDVRPGGDCPETMVPRRHPT